jgi:hypothetical protein
MRIMPRPRCRSRSAPTRAPSRVTCSAGTPVIAPARPGSPARAGRRSRSARCPAALAGDAVLGEQRSSTVVTRRPPMRRTGTPRVSCATLPSTRRSAAGDTAVSDAVPRRGRHTLRTGSMSPRSRFHLPQALVAVAEADRAVGDGDLTGARVETAGFHIAFSEVGLRDVEVAGDEELAGCTPCRLALVLQRRRGRAGRCTAGCSREEVDLRSTKNSLRMTCPIAIASAPSVPGAAATHSSANLTFSA